MKKIEKIAEPILEQVERWLKDADHKLKLVIGIEGYSAVGKTTLHEYLRQQLPDLLQVRLDDYLAKRAVRDAIRSEANWQLDWKKSGWYQYEEFERVINAYRRSDAKFTSQIYNRDTDDYDRTVEYDLSKPAMLLEGSLLFRSPAGPEIDRLIYLDGSWDEADRRRLKRHIAVRGDNYQTRERSRIFERNFRILYEKYLKKYDVRARTDLTIHVD
ncbi:MAG: hypothetical protein Q8Q11_02590 [bacterium]|nr:hypothetical protein [bacterium]MDZ4247683.1 hypothetical protein [Patescibacteria group bacterium]